MQYLGPLAIVGGVLAIGLAQTARGDEKRPAPVARATLKAPCMCRDRGRRVPVGAVVCLNGPKGPVRARCDKVLNNTSWTFLGEGCPLI